MRDRKARPVHSLQAYLCAGPVRFLRPREEAMSMTRRWNDLIEGVPGEPSGGRDIEVKGVVCDSRRVQSGFVFVAVPGTKQDGSEYVEDAVRRGCAAVVSERPLPAGTAVPVLRVASSREALAELAARFYEHPTRKLNVIGITGTNGKSTTAFLVRSILEAAGEKTGLLGTIQYSLGERILAAPMTTPGADDLQSYFAEMVAAGCKSAVMEVSSHALAQGRVHGTRFASGIFTNLTRDHLDYHATPEEYRDAKARLFEQLTDRSIAAINADDPAGDHYASRTKARVFRYGVRKGGDVRAVVESSGFHGTRFRLHLGGEEVLIQSRLVGEHNVSNMVAAASCAWGMGYDLEHIKHGLEGLATVPGRFEVVDAGQDFAVYVDYAHTDDALRNVLACLRPLVRGRILLVFGCGGDRDRGKRPEMGRVAEQSADLTIVTSDNPRSENPLDIIREIEAGIRNKSRYLIEPDRRAAIKLAVSLARKDDAVLIAGKGHESVQIFRDGARPFDDREVAREILHEAVKHGS